MVRDWLASTYTLAMLDEETPVEETLRTLGPLWLRVESKVYRRVQFHCLATDEIIVSGWTA